MKICFLSPVSGQNLLQISKLSEALPLAPPGLCPGTILGFTASSRNPGALSMPTKYEKAFGLWISQLHVKHCMLLFVWLTPWLTKSSILDVTGYLDQALVTENIELGETQVATHNNNKKTFFKDG